MTLLIVGLAFEQLIYSEMILNSADLLKKKVSNMWM